MKIVDGQPKSGTRLKHRMKMNWREELLSFLIQSLEALGHRVERVLQQPRHSSSRLKSRELLIDGEKRCHVCFSRNFGVVGKRGKRRYSHHSLAKRPFAHCSVVIICRAITGCKPEVFVVPAGVLRAAYPHRFKISFFLPCEELLPYHNRKQKIDFWKYRNAWHLL